MKDEITEELFDVIREYHIPHKESGAARNESARNALITFKEKLKAVEPEKWYNTDGLSFQCMLHFLCIIRQALIENNYEIVCNELGSLIYRYPVSEQRIRAIILQTLERYL